MMWCLWRYSRLRSGSTLMLPTRGDCQCGITANYSVNRTLTRYTGSRRLLQALETQRATIAMER
jgi:hypothetical protein